MRGLGPRVGSCYPGDNVGLFDDELSYLGPDDLAGGFPSLNEPRRRLCSVNQSCQHQEDIANFCSGASWGEKYEVTVVASGRQSSLAEQPTTRKSCWFM